MKNRRLTLVAFLLCAALIVGFGYAAVSDTLRIDGTATIDHTGANTEFDGMVYFEDATASSTKDLIVISDDKDIATVTVKSLTLKDSTATFTMYVVNDYDYPIYVTPTIDSSSTLYDDTLVKLSSTWLSQTHEIEAGEKLIYTLTVTCLDTRDASTSFAIGFAATDVAPADFVAYTGTPTGATP